MAQGCDNTCVRNNLGFKTTAEYIADFGSDCIGLEQDIYCINGTPAIAPRGCTKLFGEARFGRSSNPIIRPIPSGDTDLTQYGASTPLTYTNDTCYPMDIGVVLSAFHNVVWPDGGTMNISATFLIDGAVPLIRTGTGANVALTRAGGPQGLIGNSNDPDDYFASTYQVILADVLEPGESQTISIKYESYGVTSPAALSAITGFAAAARVSGTTSC